VVIKASSRGEVDRLIRDLPGDIVPREAAVARLAIIGTRAVDRLLVLATSTAPAEARAAALRALEGIGDRRALEPAARLLDDGDATIAGAAVGMIRSQLGSSDAGTAALALDRLTAVALDPARPAAVRSAAIDALTAVGSPVVNSVLVAIDRPGATPASPPANAPLTAIERAAKGQTDDPESLRAALDTAGNSAPLAVLHKVIAALRAREAEASPAKRRQEWTAARAAAHRALAAQGSRVALYDLRESLAAAENPLPVGFLAALGMVGDASCLEAVADAYARAAGSRRDWWRQQLARAFAEIVRRERLTPRHRALKRVEARHPTALRDLLAASELELRPPPSRLKR
jgi:hypothetical protein